MTVDKFSLPDCPLEYAANIIGGKWKIRLLWTLYESEYVRFNELKRQLNGITDTMLTKTLKELIKENIVKRVQYNEIPPRVEYSLTPNGLNLVNALNEIRKWSKETHNSGNSK
ncbi:winged helix-turn-helix transcriptional regulator [Clostridium sp. UBA6640]|uniref:winged helix-turn-helix transcriptional regulator n=1 Tax=Clostridium sp. UBA6640 TaxID=1946370 RepID=UPI0025BA5B7C|nr:helix-turn-helix domain-containing protein [Clostridium sp. UBA6640]